MDIFHRTEDELKFLENAATDYFQRHIKTMVILDQEHKCYLCQTHLRSDEHIHLVPNPHKNRILSSTYLIAICSPCYHDLLHQTQYGLREHTKNNPHLDHSQIATLSELK